MRIEHVAIWANDLEAIKNFYCRYFGATAGAMYVNPKKYFKSYFLTFTSGARLEVMHSPSIASVEHRGMVTGYAHLAMSVGSAQAVDALTERLRADGFIVAGEPRTTGDGYYESVILDPEGNHVEITI